MTATLIPIKRNSQPSAETIRSDAMMAAVRIMVKHAKAVASIQSGGDAARIRDRLKVQGEIMFLAGLQLLDESEAR